MDIDYGFFRVFGPYFIGKSLGTFNFFLYLDSGHLSDTPSCILHFRTTAICFEERSAEMQKW